jgi:hypothetical protein
MIIAIDETGDFNPDSELLSFFVAILIDQSNNGLEIKKNQFDQLKKTIPQHKYNVKGEVKGSDFLEKSMLKDFSDFVKKHLTYNWVHWNMRNSSYGFESISNRYRILGGHLKEIEDQFKFDLPEILGSLYTYNFEKHKPNGQLLNLSKRNKISDRDALIGKDEATSFENREYLKLHMSTCRKVEIIDRILSLEEKKQLKVNVGAIKIYGLTPLGLFEIVRNNWLLFLIWSIAIGILGAVLEPVFQSIFGTSNY